MCEISLLTRVLLVHNHTLLSYNSQVWAVATEDMDALTFRSPVLLRKMTFASSASAGNKGEIQQMEYDKALSGLGLTHAEFVDLCILLGCDYCDTIRGVGPKTALKLIREHHSIENILQHLDKSKYGVPESWMPPPSDSQEETSEEFVPIFVEARRLFNQHEVMTDMELKWNPCQPEPLTTFLVDEMGFNADRVKSSIEKLQKAFAATAKPQMRMDSFFKPVASAATTSSSKDDLKRKGAAVPSKDDKSAKKTKAASASSKGAAKKR
jgi:flap endonuclease-1